MAGADHHPPNKPPHPPASSAAPSSSKKSNSKYTTSNNKDPPPPTTIINNGRNPNTKPPSTPQPRNNSTNNNTKPSPKGPKDPQFSPKLDPTRSKLPPFPFLDPPPPPSYGFHMLDRRSIALADGSARSYFALPPGYHDFGSALVNRAGPGFGFERKLPMISPEPGGVEFRAHMGERGDGLIMGRGDGYWNEMEQHQGHAGRRAGPGDDGPGSSMKRKFGDEERETRDGFERQKQQLVQYGGGNVSGGMPGTSGGMYMEREGEGEEMREAKYMRASEINEGGLKHNQVDQSALKKSFLHFVKLVYESTDEKSKYLADGKQGILHCIVCGRSSNDFSDTHGLIMHAYNSDKSELIVDHLALHKVLCLLMGWNYGILPDNSKAYQLLPADEAAENVDDLVFWPPLVIIHNTFTGKSSNDHPEGMGNRAMDNYLREIGVVGGKSKASVYLRDGHLGTTLVKFTADLSGLEEALCLAEYFDKNNYGRKNWARVESLALSNDDENNPNLVTMDQKTGEKKRIFYGYLANVSDIDKIGSDIRKKITIESQREYKSQRKLEVQEAQNLRNPFGRQCQKCGNFHSPSAKCRKVRKTCFRCGRNSHKIKNCPNLPADKVKPLEQPPKPNTRVFTLADVGRDALKVEASVTSGRL